MDRKGRALIVSFLDCIQLHLRKSMERQVGKQSLRVKLFDGVPEALTGVTGTTPSFI